MQKDNEFIPDWHIGQEEKIETLATENEQDYPGDEEILPGIPFS